MTFARKLYILLTAAVVGMLTLGCFCIVQISTVFEEANYARINSIPSVEQIDQISQAFFRMRLATWQFISSSDNRQKKQLADDIRAMEKQITDAQHKYEREDISDHQDALLLAQVKSAIDGYYPKRNQILALARSGKPDQARQQLLDQLPLINEVERSIAAHRSYNQNLAVIGSQNAEAARKFAIWMALCITLLFTLGIYAGGKILVYEYDHRSSVTVVQARSSERESIRAG